MSGVGLEAYWISSYLWDFVSYIPPASFILAVLAGADMTALISGEAGVATCLVLLAYGLSMVSFNSIVVMFLVGGVNGGDDDGAVGGVVMIMMTMTAIFLACFNKINHT